jgi:sugar lactone lactonase YvrE
MKTIKKLFLKSIPKFAFLAILLLAFSCGPDAVLESETSLEAVSAKSQKGENSVLKVLAKGAALHGANGIDIGPDGNLYVASVNGQDISVINPNNGKIIKRFGPGNGVLGPDDLVFHPDGQSLYWTDILTGFVGRMDLDGNQLGYQFVAPGVNPITFSPEGRLFVGLDFLGDGLYELDPNFIDPPRHIIASTTANPYPLGFLNAFDFGTDGRLYGPLFAAGLVISVNVGNPGDPVSTDPFADGTVQVLAGGFKNPASAKFGPDGLLYVLDQTGEVFKINTLTGEKTLFTTLQPGLDNMVFDEDGTLYMTNNDEGWVAEILKSGQARIISKGGMIQPQGLAVLSGPNNKDIVYAADLFLLRQFDGKSGQQLNDYKGYLVPIEPEVGVASLILPMNVSADGVNLIISSWFSSAVQVWNPDPLIGVIENYPIGTPEFPGSPMDAIRFKNGIIVSEANKGELIWASDQSLIATLVEPSGLATDGETLWVADRSTGEIYKLDYDGTNLTAPVSVASGLQNPEGLAFEKDGSLVVVESGASRLSRIDLSKEAGKNVTTLVENLELSGPGLGTPSTWFFDGVAVGSSGDIYISGGGKNVIYRVPQNKVR